MNDITTQERPTQLSTTVITEDLIAEIGNDTGKTLTEITSKMLEMQKTSDAGVMGEKLNELIDSTKQLSADNFNAGPLKKLMNNILGLKDKAIQKFESAQDNVNLLVKKLDKERQNQVTMNKNIDTLIQANYAYCQGLIEDIKKCDEYMEQLQAQIDGFGDSLSHEESMQLTNLKNSYDLLEKKKVDFESLKVLSINMDPSLMGMKKTGTSLLQTFDNITTKMIPAYTQYFMKYLISRSQQQAMALTNKTEDIFNETITAASDLSAKNAVDAAKLSQRQLVNLDTIKKDHQNMMDAFDQVKKIEQDARANRKALLAELSDLEQKSIQAFSKKN